MIAARSIKRKRRKIWRRGQHHQCVRLVVATAGQREPDASLLMNTTAPHGMISCIEADATSVIAALNLAGIMRTAVGPACTAR